MNKIFVIRSLENHFWTSCDHIENHIQNAFDNSTLDITYCDTKDSLSINQIEEIKESIKLNKTFVYFLSDMLKVEKLCEHLSDIKDLNYIIPVYGNMTVEINRWLGIDKLLKGKPVLLIGATHRSCQQIEILTKNCSIVKIPYPFECKGLESNSQPEDKINLVYAGRLTPQKNILSMIKGFLAARELNPKLILNIAGSFHDRGYHLHGHKVNIASYQEEFEKLLSNNNDCIVYHGFLDQTSLLKLYRDMDYFTSLSTYHDEDFGYSAAQAGCVGLGFILSDWGGHEQFSKDALMIPVFIASDNLPIVNQKVFTKALIGLNKNPSISHNLKNYFSYKYFISQIEMSLDRTFYYNGQSRTYFDYCKASRTSFVFNINSKSNYLYKEIYKSYLSNYKSESDYTN